MNIYAVLAAVVMLGASHAATGWWFYGAGQDNKIAEQSAVSEAAKQAGETAAKAAAAAISKIEVKHVTINQRADTVIREVPAYRECRHDPSVLRDINEARTGIVGGGLVPPTSALGR